MKKICRALVFLILVVILVLVAARFSYRLWRVPSYTPSQEKDAISMEHIERVTMLTKDDMQIIGDYYTATGISGTVLLHMMPADRTSWHVLAIKLQEIGFHVLAIDLRGHGQSTNGPTGYQVFSDGEHQQSLFDVEAAVEFLRTKGVQKFSMGGASIGANLALQYAANHKEVAAIVLLSPGSDYHGIHADIWMNNLKPDQAALLIASDDDVYSFTSVKALYEQASHLTVREVKLFTDAGHGTAMFDKNPEMIDQIADWLKKIDIQ